MKHIIAAVALFLGTNARADMIIQPEEVVTGAITAARQDQLTRYLDTVDIAAIATHPRHAMTQSRLLAFFKSIDPALIQYAGIDRLLSVSGGTTLVRMIAPINIDFDLEMRTRDDGVKDNHWVIIGIHP